MFGNFLESLRRKLSNKKIYVPTNNLKLQSYSVKSILTLPIFSFGAKLSDKVPKKFVVKF
jgi:hypothetical protein